MRRIILFSLIFMGLNSFFVVENDSIKVNHQLNGVTVFLDNAEFFETGQTSVGAGISELVFNNVSSGILKDGIRVAATNGVQIYSVQIENDANFKENSSEYKELLDQINRLDEQKDKLHQKIDLYEKQMDYLEANYKLNMNVTVTQAQIDEGQKYFHRKMEEISNQIWTWEQEVKQLGDRISVLEKEQTLLSSRLEKKNAIIKIKVKSEKATATEIQLHYLVTRAVWLPLYAIRAHDDSNKVVIEYQAQLYNDTGIDWHNIPITLAMINASQDIGIPEMATWTIDGDKNKFNYKIAKGDYSGKNDYEGDLDDSKTYDLVVDDLNTRFEIQNKHIIPSDAVPHTIDIDVFEKEVSYYTLSIPKVKSGAYKIASISDWESLGLIDGFVNLYYNETFQGKTFLKMQQIEDFLDVSVGKDQSWIINRKKMPGKSRKSLIGNTITEQFKFEISVKNNKNLAQAIEIKDQIPISISKEIEINITDISNAKLDPVTGELIWKLNLGPNEVKKLQLSFSVKYPSSKRYEINYNQNSIKSPRYF